MSYALLWLETLIASLLWIATLAAFTARFNRKWPVRPFSIFVGLVPFVALGALTSLTAMLKFNVDLYDNWFGYTLSLLLAFVLGTVVILSIGSRRPGPGLERQWASWPRGRLLLAMLTVVSIGAMTLWNMDLEVRSQAGVMKTEAGALMLEVSPAYLPDSQNAAILYDKAFARLAADSSLKAEDSPINQDKPDPKNPATIDLLKRHSVTLKLLHQAAMMPDCRFEHDFARPSITMMLPELHWARTSAELLRLHARSELSQGHVKSAITDTSAILHLGRAVGQEPIIVTTFVAFGLDGLAVNLLQEILPAVTRADDLAGLDLGDAELETRLIRRGFQGEEAFGLAIFSDLASGQLTMQDLGPMTADPHGSPKPLFSLLREPFPMLQRVFLMVNDVKSYRLLMQQYQQAATKPYPEARAIAARAEQSLRNPRMGLLTSIIAPALSHARKTAAKAEAIHATGRVAVAMTRYRLDHGTVPETLDPLVPDYLEEVPLDPFDGKPLRLIHKGDEWLIYSIGPDLHDDSGQLLDSQTGKGDIGFALKMRH